MVRLHRNLKESGQCISSRLSLRKSYLSQGFIRTLINVPFLYDRCHDLSDGGTYGPEGPHVLTPSGDGSCRSTKVPEGRRNVRLYGRDRCHPSGFLSLDVRTFYSSTVVNLKSLSSVFNHTLPFLLSLLKSSSLSFFYPPSPLLIVPSPISHPSLGRFLLQTFVSNRGPTSRLSGQ